MVDWAMEFIGNVTSHDVVNVVDTIVKLKIYDYLSEIL